MAFSVGSWLQRVREARPLVHNITNQVVMNVTANALLAVGASPVMAHAHEEAAEMAALAQSLVLNLGTLTPHTVVAMRLAGSAAGERGTPVVLDPVGAGATRYRSETAQQLLRELPITVLRGNAGEIGVLAGIGGSVRGVDAEAAGVGLQGALQELAARTGAVVVATGAVDLVSDGQRVAKVANGHPLLSAVTGTGCMLTAVLGAFSGAAGPRAGARTYAEAAAAALACYGVAAENAAGAAQGPGSFQVALFDALYNLTPAQADAQARVTWS